jgi:hypothetical protein
MEGIGVRWTIGDVSPAGFEALCLSIWGAWRIFGASAGYAVCVNTVPLQRAREWTGDLPVEVSWRDARGELPGFLAERLDPGMAEGVAWRFAPLRLFPDRVELSLDNDCILWRMPPAMGQWLADVDPRASLLAEDDRTCLGQFADLCGPEPRNSGIRGVKPGLDLEAALRAVLAARPVRLCSELDAQGLQVAALSRRGRLRAVSAEDVTICSPFPPHVPRLGRCGAHFVGLNARHLPWQLDGRPAEVYVQESWRRHRTEIQRRVGFAPTAAAPAFEPC